MNLVNSCNDDSTINVVIIIIIIIIVILSGLIANWKDKIQGLFKDFQVPKIAVFKYQKYQYKDISYWRYFKI